MSKLYTGKGDDGTTGLLFGGRVPKDDDRPEAYGTVDEAQAAIGLARAAAPRGGEVDEMLVDVERDLYVLMAELATLPENQHKLTPGQSSVTADQVAALGTRTDDLGERFEFPTEFVVPGQNELSARLDVARTVVRRAERAAVVVDVDGSHVVPYLNRLSSLLWTMARWTESGDTLRSRTATTEEP
ncbi:cob(I)yrinic acid a,c-diamide adenosyltransferase [Actinospongicola halichondriae]|uniref:cob(I)yrinic acid a,c-diamide adenosyltransferase n=1 Tax=Actinospongicola halichondriae TaxID=3236844 RepID=UPI003D4C3F6D